MPLRTWVTNPLLRGVYFFLLLVSIGLTIYLAPKVTFETNILAMLPRDTQKGSALEMSKNYTESQAKQVLFLLEGVNRDSLSINADSVLSAIEKSDLFTIEDKKSWYSYYFPRRVNLISKEFARKLEQGGVNALKKEVYGNLFSPIPNAYGDLIQKDPLFLFPTFMQQLVTPQEGVDYDKGKLIFDTGDSVAVLFTASLRGNVFEESVQKEFNSFIASTKSEYSLDEDSFSYTGFITYSNFYLNTAKHESQILGGISSIAVILLILLCFKQITTLFKSVIPILAGLTGGFAATALFYDKIHLIAVSMGVCLIGVCVDYTFHYLVEYRSSGQDKWDSWKGLFHIFPGISLGVITSILGYAVFFLIPYEGLQQIALFTISGLLLSYGAVLFLFPVLFKKRSAEKKLKQSSRFANSIKGFLRLYGHKQSHVVILVIGLLSLTGLIKISFNDSISLFKVETPQLDQVEAKVKKYYPELQFMNRYVLSHTHRDSLLLQLEQMELDLEEMVSDSGISSYSSISQYVPSLKRQKESRKLLWETLSKNRDECTEFFTSLGFSASSVDSLLSQSEESDFITVENWVNDPVSSNHRGLWLGELQNRFYTVVTLSGVQADTSVDTLVAKYALTDIDTQKSIKGLLQGVRTRLVYLIPLMYLAIFILLLFRYHFKKALTIIAVPLCVYLCTLSILSLLSMEITIMHLLALNLVLGIGIDYVLFFTETVSAISRTFTAIILSAMTTLLSFGLLALSSTPALSAIGVTVIIGIILSLLFAPLIVERKAILSVEGDRDAL